MVQDWDIYYWSLTGKLCIPNVLTLLVTFEDHSNVHAFGVLKTINKLIKLTEIEMYTLWNQLNISSCCVPHHYIFLTSIMYCWNFDGITLISDLKYKLGVKRNAVKWYLVNHWPDRVRFPISSFKNEIPILEIVSAPSFCHICFAELVAPLAAAWCLCPFPMHEFVICGHEWIAWNTSDVLFLRSVSVIFFISYFCCQDFFISCSFSHILVIVLFSSRLETEAFGIT